MHGLRARQTRSACWCTLHINHTQTRVLHYLCGKHTMISSQDLAHMRAQHPGSVPPARACLEIAERNLLLHARALDGGAIVLHS